IHHCPIRMLEANGIVARDDERFQIEDYLAALAMYRRHALLERFRASEVTARNIVALALVVWLPIVDQIYAVAPEFARIFKEYGQVLKRRAQLLLDILGRVFHQ